MKKFFGIPLAADEKRISLKIASIFAMVAGTWFLFIDKILSVLFNVPTEFTYVQILNDWFFVLLMAVMLGWLIRHQVRALRRKDEVLREIAQGISVASGEAFFHALTEHLAKALVVDNVILCELAEGPSGGFRTVAAYQAGKRVEARDCPVAGKVWEKVISDGVCRYPEKVRQEFPQDTLLSESAAESFIGISLPNSEGQVIGIMAVIDHRPIKETELAETILSLFAVRAAVEVERQRVVEKLQENEERFQAIADYTHDWENWHAPDGRLLWVNPSVERITGYSPEECLVMPDFTRTLIHEEDQDAVAKIFQQSLTGQTSGNDLRFRIWCKDGSVLWVAVSWQPIFNLKMEYLGIRSSIRDVSAQKEAEEKLEVANRELDAFAYTVAHDLRTPLTPIIGFVEFLREQYQEQLDEKALGSLTEIEKQARRMLGMMEDLLDLARVGQAERPTEPVDVAEVVDEVLIDLGGLLISTELAVVKGPLSNVNVPRSLLFQVFDNLIGNALRYAGPQGGPIEVGGERQEQRMRYFVRDHGPGIPPAERSRIFEVFFRGVSGKSSMGTGVGLATVQKIARLYGGRTWVEETPGGGCTFWVDMMDDGPEMP